MSKIIKSPIKSPLPGKVIGVREIPIQTNMELEDADTFIEIEKQKILNQYQDKAQSIIDEAKQNAHSVKQQIENEKKQWLEEKQTWIEEAKKMGYEQGLSEGRHNGYEEYKGEINVANQIVDDTKKEFIKYLEESEKVILNLGMVVAEKILCDTLENFPDKFLSFVKQAIKEVRENQEIKIVVHPSQYHLLLSRKDELDSLLANQAQCYIYANEQFELNQCHVETENGRIDASIDSQLKMLKETLFELLEGEHE